MPESVVTPLNLCSVKALKAGDFANISGIIYVARDAAHKKMIELLEKGESLPFDICGQIIYYAGPCPGKPGQVIGSCGPTTSGRMDAYTPRLIELGLSGMIGKGIRSKEVIEAMKHHGAVYFGAVGGAGALISKCIVSQEIVAFPELGPEALRKIEVRDLPTIVVIDSYGSNLYESGITKYQKHQ